MTYAAIPLAFLVLWVFFLAYSALLSNWKHLRIEVKLAGAVVVLVGGVVDVALNWTLGLALGVGPWKEWTLSQKCSRLKLEDGWRQAVALYLCSSWLDPFQVGGHCR